MACMAYPHSVRLPRTAAATPACRYAHARVVEGQGAIPCSFDSFSFHSLSAVIASMNLRSCSLLPHIGGACASTTQKFVLAHGPSSFIFICSFLSLSVC